MLSQNGPVLQLLKMLFLNALGAKMQWRIFIIFAAKTAKYIALAILNFSYQYLHLFLNYSKKPTGTLYGPSAGKGLFSWLSACAGLLCAALIVFVPFPFCVWGRMWNDCIGS